MHQHPRAFDRWTPTTAAKSSKRPDAGRTSILGSWLVGNWDLAGTLGMYGLHLT